MFRRLISKNHCHRHMIRRIVSNNVNKPCSSYKFNNIFNKRYISSTSTVKSTNKDENYVKYEGDIALISRYYYIV